MKVQAQILNESNLKPLKHIAIIGNDEFFRENAYLKIQTSLQNQQLPPPESFQIDEASFQWESIYAKAHNTSLFDDVTIITLRANNALKKQHHEMLSTLLSKASEHIYFIIVLNKFTKAQEKQAWFKHIQQHGLLIEANPLPNYQLPAFIKQKMAQYGLSTSNQGYELLAECYQGNLLGLDQEIHKLSLIFNQGMIKAEDLSECISNQAQNTIFQCIDYALNQMPMKSLAILKQLKKEKQQPAVILWNMVNEIRTLSNMRFDMDKGMSLTAVFDKYRIWQSKKGQFSKQLQQRTLSECYQLIQQAKQVDETIKGLNTLNAWQSIENLLIRIAT